eukprot:5286021-Prymnesium_polylepis.1
MLARCCLRLTTVSMGSVNVTISHMQIRFVRFEPPLLPQSTGLASDAHPHATSMSVQARVKKRRRVQCT